MMEIIHFACSNAIYNMNTSYYIFLVNFEFYLKMVLKGLLVSYITRCLPDMTVPNPGHSHCIQFLLL